MNTASLPFKSDLFYSVQNEDYRTELTVLKRIGGDAQRVLLVASSGENALSLLAYGNIVQLAGIDINAAQLQLCELRRTAGEFLSPADQLLLVGAELGQPSLSGSQERLGLYEQIRLHLPDKARQFWDACRDNEIAYGIQQVGRNDLGMQDIRTQVQAAGFAPFAHPLTDADLSRWRAVYEALFTPEYIQGLFGMPSKQLAERITRIAGYLGECHFRALQQPESAYNPYLTTVFTGTYPTLEAGLPYYLQTSGQASLKQTAARLHLYAGNILDWIPRLAAAEGAFDLVSISNIADWMTEEEFRAVVIMVRGVLKTGGALLARTATPNRMIETIMSQELDVDLQFNVELSQVERGAWFRVISAGFKS